MQSRMDKYQTNKPNKYERIKKNTKLYEDVYDDIYRDTTYQNMQVIDSAKEININKLKNIIDDKYDTRQYRTLQNYSIEDETYDEMSYYNNKERIYDINQIINDAKNKRSFIEEAKEKQKYLNYDDYNIKSQNDYDGLQNEEKELEELINTITIPKENINNDDNELDLFSDLKGSENTIVTNPISASFEVNTDEFSKEGKLEKTVTRTDKTFYTDSNMFTKNDFEDFNTLSNELTSSSKIKKIIIIVLILTILLGTGYYVITKFIMK